MFETIRLQMQTIESFLQTLGYDEVYVHNFTVRETEVAITITARDDFQKEVAELHKHKNLSWHSLTGADLPEIWSRLYALPSRATRELHVLANQLSGIAGMESQLHNIRVQQMIGPILEAREEMKKLLAAPQEAADYTSDPEF